VKYEGHQFESRPPLDSHIDSLLQAGIYMARSERCSGVSHLVTFGKERYKCDATSMPI
jgi:hypothetical protein